MSVQTEWVAQRACGLRTGACQATSAHLPSHPLPRAFGGRSTARAHNKRRRRGRILHRAHAVVTQYVGGASCGQCADAQGSAMRMAGHTAGMRAQYPLGPCFGPLQTPDALYVAVGIEHGQIVAR